MAAPESAVETRVLNRHPDIRDRVKQSPEFEAWRRGLRALEVDGETLYVRGGDMLRDEDQVIFEWAHRTGLLTDAAIQSALADDDA